MAISRRITVPIALVLVLASSLVALYTNRISLPAGIEIRPVVVEAEVNITEGSVQQGIVAIADKGLATYFSSDHPLLFKFDSNWRLIKQRKIDIPGVSTPHIGALILSPQGMIFAGVIDTDSYSVGNINTRIISINPDDLSILSVHDSSEITRYIDALAFDSDERLWFSYKEFLYVLDKLDGVVRPSNVVRKYRILTGTAQGLVIKDGNACVVGENNLMRVRQLPDGIYCYRLDKMKPYSETLASKITSVLDDIISSLNYRLNVRWLNIYLSSQVNMPSVLYPFGFPEDDPDNEGFSFVPGSRDTIWVSDEGGRVARRVRLVGF